MNILILDDTFTQIALLSNYLSLNFYRSFSTMGSFELNINVNDLYAQELKVGRLIYLDSERVGIIEKVVINHEDNKGGEILTATGIELKDVISRRISIPPAGVIRDYYPNETTENIIRSLIDKHIINPTDASRKMNNFSLCAANGNGSSIEYSTRYIGLHMDIYTRLLQWDLLGLVLTVDIVNKTAVYEVRSGVNRTVEQTANPTAIFSLELGTSSNTTITDDESSMFNFIVAGGSGEGLTRPIATVPTANIPTGITRCEAFDDNSNAQTVQELEYDALITLAKKQGLHSIDCNTPLNNTLEYSLGDYVTIIDNKINRQQNLQISAIHYRYRQAELSEKNILFGSAPLNLGDAINARLSGMENILTK